MTDYARILAENGLDVVIEPADGNDAMPNPLPGMTHWTVLVDGGVAPVAFGVSILREGEDATPPTVDEAFSFLSADLAGFAATANQGEWLKANGVQATGHDSDAWATAYATVGALVSDVEENLPEDLADAVMGRDSSPSPSAKVG